MMRSGRVSLLLSFAAISIPMMLLGAQAPSTVPAKAINPHWLTDACDQCHVMKDGKAQTIGFAEAERICLKCHDGVRATAEPHPVHRPLGGEQYKDPGWPLLDGAVVCQTCHDISLTAGHKSAQAQRSDWLRPPQGQGPDAFCSSCHMPVEYSRINPHRMMTPQGQVVPADCLLCHTAAPDPRTMTRTGKWDLRAEVMTLCRSCHYYHVDWFEPGHMEAKVSPKTLAYMRAREVAGPTTRPSRRMIAELQAQGVGPQVWALGPGNTLICTSCHNPHQRGVFPESSVMAHDAMEIQGNRVVTQIEVPRMCLRCHNL